MKNVAKIRQQINYLNTYIYDSDLEMVQLLFIKDGSVWTIGGPAKEKGIQQILKSLRFIGF